MSKKKQVSRKRKLPKAHCWHADGIAMSMAWATHQGEKCCWCGATRNSVSGAVRVHEGHGPHAVVTEWRISYSGGTHPCNPLPGKPSVETT